MIAIVVLALRIAMAIALFSFLGWALFTLWQELRQQANSLSTLKIPIINLEVITGQETRIPNFFTENEIVIGRDKNCTLPVSDEAVSAQHALITFHHRQWWLEDLNSTNGTFLNQEKIISPIVLTTGDELKCGDTLFRVRIGFDHQPSPAQELESGGST